MIFCGVLTFGRPSVCTKGLRLNFLLRHCDASADCCCSSSTEISVFLPSLLSLARLSHLPLQALAYDGPAYRGLDAATFSEEDWAFGAGSVRLLSGLYGVLRPGDLIQPYRLEMGSRWVGEWVGGFESRDMNYIA